MFRMDEKSPNRGRGRSKNSTQGSAGAGDHSFPGYDPALLCDVGGRQVDGHRLVGIAEAGALRI